MTGSLARIVLALFIAAVGGCGGSDPVGTPPSDPSDPSEPSPFDRDAASFRLDAGSSVDAGPDDLPRSGTRIRQVFHEANGFRVPTSFEDTMLDNERCIVLTAADGAERCLPAVTAVSNEYYLDADCQTPLANVIARDGCITTPRYLRVRSDTCPVRNSLYRISEEVDPGETVYRDVGGSCTETAASSIQRHFTFDETEIDPTTFVEFREVPFDADGRLRRVVLEGSDGSRVSPGWFDAAQGERCLGEVAADGERRCLPFQGTASFRFVAMYEDDACETLLPSHGFVGCVPGYLWRGVGGDQDERRTSVQRVGMPVPKPDQAFRFSGSAGPRECVSTPTLDDLTYHRLDPPIPPAELAPLDLEPAPGVGLVARQETSEGRSIPVAWYDTSRDARCTPRRTRDGRLRCLPSAASLRTLYRDELCRDEVVVAVAYGGRTPAFGIESDERTCTTRYAAWNLSAEPVERPDSWYASRNGQCIPSGFSDGAEFFEATSPVSDDEFSEVLVVPDG